MHIYKLIIWNHNLEFEGSNKKLKFLKSQISIKFRKQEDCKNNLVTNLINVHATSPKENSESLSHVRLFVTPWTAAYQAPPSMEFFRQEY